MEPIILDMNDVLSGKPDLANFTQAIANYDWSQYRGQHVQLKGCCPTWAHLLAAGRLVTVAQQIDFIIDDGKGGKVVPFFPAA